MTNVDPNWDPNVAHTVDPPATTSADPTQTPQPDPAAAQPGDLTQNPSADPAAAQPAPPPAPTPDPATSPAPAPTSAPAPSPASAPAARQLDVLGATAQVAGIQRAQQAQPAPAPAPEPEYPKWNEGDLVRHRWVDPHGPKEAYGLVMAVTHDDGAEDRVEVLWISSDRSGPIPASQLEDPSEDK